MAASSRCAKCMGPLDEDNPACPWCGFDTSIPVENSKSSQLSILIRVAVVGLLAISLVYLISTADKQPDENVMNTDILLSFPEISNRSIDGDVRWDASFDVNKITPKDQTIRWSDLYIVINRADGTPLQRQFRLVRKDPSQYDDASDGSIDIETWYIDNVGGKKNLDRDDGIVITGLGMGFEGGWVTIYREGVEQGQCRLPEAFE